MFKGFCIGILIFVSGSCWAQDHAWIYFKDKLDSNSYLENPLLMLSQKAIDRREKQQIAIDLTDVPITQSYISSINANSSIEVKAKSKWFNAVHVIGPRDEISALAELSFVDHIDLAANEPLSKKISTKQTLTKFGTLTDFNYGGAANQIQMINLDYLHQQNFTGSGMTIAVLDGGFPNVDSYAAFERLRNQNHIKGGYNFVMRNSNFYTGISHGTSVLSIMGGFVDNQLIGTAPDADYYLFITEDGASETPLEESLWVEAAEMADSLGVDVINTSLGYSTFDDPRYNYTYNDMNGKTTFISRGADIAFSRGMFIVNSAGNEGNKSWHYITAPGDAVDVLTIGAVDAAGVSTGFSSYGPSADGRVKPDVTAKGGGTTVLNAAGTVSTGNGTSFSGPVITGAVACLWQAYPTKTNREILEIIRSSGDLFNVPNDQKGYGIPNFKNAFATLVVQGETLDKFSLYPNPVREELFLKFAPNTVHHVTIFDSYGRKLWSSTLDNKPTKIDVSQFTAGIYLLQINQSKLRKFIKQ